MFIIYYYNLQIDFKYHFDIILFILIKATFYEIFMDTLFTF